MKFSLFLPSWIFNCKSYFSSHVSFVESFFSFFFLTLSPLVIFQCYGRSMLGAVAVHFIKKRKKIYSLWFMRSHLFIYHEPARLIPVRVVLLLHFFNIFILSLFAFVFVKFFHLLSRFIMKNLYHDKLLWQGFIHSYFLVNRKFDFPK